MNATLCRTCLCKKANKNISELQGLKKGHSSQDVVLFCLDIQVEEESKVSTKLCLKCFTKIKSFYKFKLLALKNDAYLRNLESSLQVKDEILLDDIKKEETSLNGSDDDSIASHASDNKDPVLNDNIKLELKGENESDFCHSDEEFLSVIKKIKNENPLENVVNSNEQIEKSEENVEESKENGPYKRKGRKKGKLKPSEKPKQVCEECGKRVRDLKAHSNQHIPKPERKRVPCKLCDKTFSSLSTMYKHKRNKHFAVKKACPKCNKKVAHLRQHDLLMHNVQSLQYVCPECGRRCVSRSALAEHALVHSADRPHQCDLCDAKYRTKVAVLQHRSVGRVMYACPECGRRCVSRSALAEHALVHSADRPHQCDLCDAKYRTKVAVLQHRSVGRVMYACPECGRRCVSRSALAEHALVHSADRPHQCDLCDAKYRTKVAVLQHRSVGRVMYACPECGRRCVSRSALAEHALVHSADRPHQCDLCDAKYRTKVAVLQHRSVGRVMYACPECGRRCVSRSALAEHALVHSADRPHQCDLCDAKYRTKVAVLQHRSVGRVMYACPECGRRCVSRSALAEHALVHSADRPHQCDLCDAKYRTKVAVLQHRSVGRVMYACPECGRRCVSRSALAEHALVHSADRPHQCDLCDAKYRTKVAVLQHRSVGRVMYACPECGRRCVSRSALAEHALVHSADRPHQCDLCDAKYRTKVAVLQHRSVGRVMYACPECGRRCVSRSALAEHALVHSADRPHQCDLCDAKYRTKVAVLQHRSVGRVMYACPECGRRCVSRSALAEHALVHSADRPHQCDLCDAKYRTKVAVLQHRSVGRVMYACPECGRRCVSRSALAEHALVHSADRPHQCDLCDAKYRTKVAVLQHRSVGRVMYACPECGRRCVSRSALAEHALVHSADRPHQCDLCDAKYRTKVAVLQHRSVGRVMYACPECGRRCVSRSALAEHALVHSADRPHQCDLCDAKYRTKVAVLQHRSVGRVMYACPECGRRCVSRSALAEHALVHSADRPHQCDLCDAKYWTKVAVLQHRRRVHEKEKSHLCQFCSKSFFKKYHLQVHLRSHTKEKPYSCEECGKSFSSSTIMKNHRMTHSEEKVYACTHCDMSFVRPGYLTAHMLSHTKEKKYPCKYCGVRFHRSDHRKRHQYTAHERHLLSAG